MTLDELTLKLGNCNSIEMASAKYSKHDALTKIVDQIKKKGLDVDEQYLDFIESLEFQSVYVDVKYVPVYCVTSIAKLSWKEQEEGQDPIDHQEFCRYNTVFYGRDNDKSDRINKLAILNVVDKKALNLSEKKYNDNDETVLRIGTGNPNCDISHLPARSEVIMDAPVEFGEYYDLDTDYLCSPDEIDRRCQRELEKTKSYKKLQKEREKWSEIVKKEIKVILVPIASLEMGEHFQLVNCANGTLDVIYEPSHKITEQVNKAKAYAYPTVIVFGVSSIGACVTKCFTHNAAQWENFGIKFVFNNLFDIMWLLIFLVGVVSSVIALPTRKGIVKRATKQKNVFTVVKISTRVIINCTLLMVLLLILCLSK